MAQKSRDGTFSVGRTMPTPSSPSLLLGNLSVCGDLVAFADGGDVHVVNMSQRSAAVTSPKLKASSPRKNSLVPFPKSLEMVFGIELMEFGGIVLLIVAHVGGVAFWRVSPDMRSVASHELSKNEYARGIAQLDDKVYVGSSSGTIFIFAVSPHEICLESASTPHTSSVTAMASFSLTKVASGDEKGEIKLWGNGTSTDLSRANDAPVTALAFLLADMKESQHNNYLCAAGFSTGCVKIYAATHILVAEIQAHSRCVTALDVSGEYICTVGEDCFVHVWSFNDLQGGDSSSSAAKGGEDDVQLIYSKEIESCILTGVRFYGKRSGSSFLVAAYDVDHLYTFEKR